MIEYLENTMAGWGVGTDAARYLSWITVVVAIIILSVISNWVAKKILLVGISRLIKKTKIAWDDYLLKHKVFTRLSHLAPALVIYFSATVFTAELHDYIQRFSTVFSFTNNLYIGLRLKQRSQTLAYNSMVVR